MSRVNHAWLGLSDGQGQGHPYGERQANLVLEQANAHRTRRSQGRPAQPLAWRQVGISSVDDGTGEGSCAAMVGAGRGGAGATLLLWCRGLLLAGAGAVTPSLMPAAHAVPWHVRCRWSSACPARRGELDGGGATVPV